MNLINVYQYPNSANLQQLSIKREWMEKYEDKHAYHCFPISLSNTLGWGVSFPKEISFIWDGITDTTSKHIKVLSGEEYCSPSRGSATVTLQTGLFFVTDENTTLLTIPVPNAFDQVAAQCYTTLMTTSFHRATLQIGWRAVIPDTLITIPANTPVASLIPISLKKIQEYEMNVTKSPVPRQYLQEQGEHARKFEEITKDGKFSHLYRNAKKQNKDSVHEVRTLKLKTTRGD